MSIRRDNKEISDQEAMLDTGSSKSIIGEEKVRELGMKREIKATNIKMKNASRKEMKISGVIELEMKDKNDNSKKYQKITLIVTPEIRKIILLSTSDQKIGRASCRERV